MLGVARPVTMRPVPHPPAAEAAVAFTSPVSLVTVTVCSASAPSVWRVWLLTNSRAVVLVVLMIAGAYVFFRGLHGLVR